MDEGHRGDAVPGDLNPRLMEEALQALSSRDRAILELASEYGSEDAAVFFEVPVDTFDALVSAARRRLLRQYERLAKGALSAWGVIANRLGRVRRWVAEHAPVHDGRAISQTIEAIASSTAITFAVVTGLVAGGATLSGSSGVAAPPPLASPSRGALEHRVIEPSEMTRQPLGFDRLDRRSKSLAVPLTGLSAAPARHPEERAYGVEATPPVPPPDGARALGVSPGPIGAGVSYHCPPPNARPPVLSAVCALTGQ